MKHYLYLILLFSLFSGFCRIQYSYIKTNVVNLNHENISNSRVIKDSIVWTKNDFGLWTSNQGDIGLQEVITHEKSKPRLHYIIKLDDGQFLKNVIDTTTFVSVGANFYKDSKHVYYHYRMAGGGKIWIIEGADPLTFKHIGGYYAKDKYFVYAERIMKVEQADVKSFITCDSCGAFGRDGINYFEFGEVINLKDVVDIQSLKQTEILDSLFDN